MTEAAIVPVQVATAAIEGEVVRTLGIALVGRRTPIVTVLSLVEERRPETIASGREKDAVAILFACHSISPVSALRCPCPCTIVNKFLPLSLRGYSPTAAPIPAGGVVQRIPTDIAEVFLIRGTVTFPIFGLGTRLSPSIVVATFFRFISSYIARCPL